MPFEGFLSRWTLQRSVLELRFFSGNFEDAAKDGVVYVTVTAPADWPGLENRLSELEPYETELLVQDPSPTEITVFPAYGDPIVFRGEEVRLRQVDFEAEDYARLAKQHHLAADDANDALNSLYSRVAETKRLLADQSRRIAEKAKGHKVGSTARTLYEQQLSFISRVMNKLENL